MDLPYHLYWQGSDHPQEPEDESTADNLGENIPDPALVS